MGRRGHLGLHPLASARGTVRKRPARSAVDRPPSETERPALLQPAASRSGPYRPRDTRPGRAHCHSGRIDRPGERPVGRTELGADEALVHSRLRMVCRRGAGPAGGNPRAPENPADPRGDAHPDLPAPFGGAARPDRSAVPRRRSPQDDPRGRARRS